MSNEITLFDPFDPKKIYDDLINRCKSAKKWEIRCIIDESFVGIAPFDIRIEDGIFHCYVICPTLKEAYVEVSNKLPVIRFLKNKDEP
jgi:hypothetical protein